MEVVYDILSLIKNTQKSFAKISYISYTTAQDSQYLLTILGEG